MYLLELLQNFIRDLICPPAEIRSDADVLQMFVKSAVCERSRFLPVVKDKTLIRFSDIQRNAGKIQILH